ncbi:LysR family transcriptional regulator [Clostridioides difficile]
MDIKQLEYFICVAELLNFTKAAEKLYISQTAISQQIKSLEDSLNVKLFIRNNRKVSLTPAGEAFYKKSKLIVNDVNEAINEAVKTASGYNGSLKIGFTSGHSTFIIYNLVKRFLMKYPDIDITILDDNFGNLYEDLNNKNLDLVFSVDFNLKEIKNFRFLHLNSDYLYVIMNKDHPLSQRKSLCRSDLKNEKFVFMNRKEVPLGYDKFVSNCINAGFSPNIVKHCNSLESLSLLIKLGIGITILPKFHIDDFEDDLIFIPLRNEEFKIDNVLIWNEFNSNPTVNLFLKHLESL